jgi:pimeloyl-ACP methyl ester carboxylesterase
MPWMSRRKMILGGVAVGAAAGAGAYVWNLHQHIPPRDPAAEDRFRRAQDRLLAEGGNTIHSRYVQLEAPKMRAQTLEGGQGEPVLMIHGGFGTAAQFEPLLSRLSSDFHVYAPDRPGCGLSDMFSYVKVPVRQHAVDFIGSTMDALGLKSTNIVGNSMGGYFGLVFALAHPERVTRLITVGEPAGSSADTTKAQGPLTIRGVNGLLYSTIMKPSPESTYERFKRKLVAHPERLSKTYLDCNTASLEIPGAIESWITLLEDVDKNSARAKMTYGLRPELGKLTMPTLMIWGEKDTFGPPSLAVEMTAMIPRGKAVTIPDAGHLTWLDQPSRVEASIRTFLQSQI